MIALGILLTYVAMSGMTFAAISYIEDGPSWGAFAFSLGAIAVAFAACGAAFGGLALIAAGVG